MDPFRYDMSEVIGRVITMSEPFFGLVTWHRHGVPLVHVVYLRAVILWKDICNFVVPVHNFIFGGNLITLAGVLPSEASRLGISPLWVEYSNDLGSLLPTILTNVVQLVGMFNLISARIFATECNVACSSRASWLLECNAKEPLLITIARTDIGTGWVI